MQEHAISIWFFIGALFVIYGALVLGAGIYGLFVPAMNIAMPGLHISVWWGCGMMALGLLFAVRFRPGRSE